MLYVSSKCYYIVTNAQWFCAGLGALTLHRTPTLRNFPPCIKKCLGKTLDCRDLFSFRAFTIFFFKFQVHYPNDECCFLFVDIVKYYKHCAMETLWKRHLIRFPGMENQLRLETAKFQFFIMALVLMFSLHVNIKIVKKPGKRQIFRTILYRAYLSITVKVKLVDFHSCMLLFFWHYFKQCFIKSSHNRYTSLPIQYSNNSSLLFQI